MDPKTIANQYLTEAKVLQIATMHSEQPRVTSVYFIASPDSRAVYWMSEPRRRHSVDITFNPKASGAIVFKPDHPVSGLQFIGTAKEITSSAETKEIANRYAEKYNGFGKDLYERFLVGANKHCLYKLSISELELFDEVHFPGGEVIVVPLI